MSCSGDGCQNRAVHEVVIEALDGVGDLQLCDEHMKQFMDAFGDDPAARTSLLPQADADRTSAEAGREPH